LHNCYWTIAPLFCLLDNCSSTIAPALLYYRPSMDICAALPPAPQEYFLSLFKQQCSGRIHAVVRYSTDGHPALMSRSTSCTDLHGWRKCKRIVPKNSCYIDITIIQNNREFAVILTGAKRSEESCL